jgi:Flp pilus assembly protein TadG
MTIKKPFPQRGVAAVEFAILLPLLLFIVFGITEFGRAIFYYNTLVKATRDAARYVAGLPAGGGADAVAKCLASHGTADCSGSPLAPGLTAAMVSVCDWSRDFYSSGANCPNHYQQQLGSNPPAVNLVTVTISGYPFQSLVPFVTANLSSITFGDISTTMQSNL